MALTQVARSEAVHRAGVVHSAQKGIEARGTEGGDVELVASVSLHQPIRARLLYRQQASGGH